MREDAFVCIRCSGSHVTHTFTGTVVGQSGVYETWRCNVCRAQKLRLVEPRPHVQSGEDGPDEEE